MNEKLKQEVEAAGEAYSYNQWAEKSFDKNICLTDFKSGAQFVYDKLEQENKDLKYLLDSINKYVIPGELDSSEAATEIIKKQREEIKELRGLFSVQIDMHDKIVNLEKKLEIAAIRFKEINNEELSNQRPGGGYSKSAIISFKAIKEIEGVK